MAENSRDFLRVMVGTGLRFGEITALWVEDIDLPKTPKSRRTITIAPSVVTSQFGRR